MHFGFTCPAYQTTACEVAKEAMIPTPAKTTAKMEAE
jgi:hypothetical protein